MALLTKFAPGRARTAAALAAGFLWLLLALPSTALAAEARPEPEYQLKAVFLFNFAQFVEWPARSFRSPEAPLVIGVSGTDPFGSYLDNLVTGEKVGTHPLVVRRYRRDEDPSDCHILFVCASESAILGPSLARLKGQTVLTVSDIESFSRQGGMVRFVTEGGKIRLRINVDAAKAVDLRISSKILRPATVVTREKD